MARLTTMAVKKRIENVASGFNYTIYAGCDTRNGRALIGTADRIIGGWAPTRSSAEARATDALESLA